VNLTKSRLSASSQIQANVMLLVRYLNLADNQHYGDNSKLTKNVYESNRLSFISAHSITSSQAFLPQLCHEFQSRTPKIGHLKTYVNKD